MFKTPQDAFTAFQTLASTFPKSPEETKEIFVKLKRVFDSEQKKCEEMWRIYGKASSGDASPNEILAANKMAQELLVSTRFAFLLAMPGVIFILPTIVKMAKDYGVDIVPASVQEEFKV